MGEEVADGTLFGGDEDTGDEKAGEDEKEIDPGPHEPDVEGVIEKDHADGDGADAVELADPDLVGAAIRHESIVWATVSLGDEGDGEDGDVGILREAQGLELERAVQPKAIDIKAVVSGVG